MKSNHSTVIKQFVLDYNSPVQAPLVEQEVGDFNYRYVYGNERLQVRVSPVENAAGSIQEGSEINLYYHTDRLGTTDYLTTPISNSRVISWTSYNEWGEITHNAVLKCGHRELDLVKNYTGHEYDAVLDMYYAKARMYDADNRRFAAVDPIKGFVSYPQTLVAYVYVVDNPLKYVDPDGLKPYSVTASGSKNKGKYTLYISPQELDATQSAIGMVPVIGWGFTAGNWAGQRLTGFREIDYNITIDTVSVAAGITELLSENKAIKAVSKGVGGAADVVEASTLLYDLLVEHRYQIEEAVYNHFDNNIWLSDSRDLVDRKFNYAMNNVAFMIANGAIEVRNASDVFPEDSFGKGKGSGIMMTWQYDPLTDTYKFYHQNAYYLFVVDCDAINNTISDLEATIKQGVWLD